MKLRKTRSLVSLLILSVIVLEGFNVYLSNRLAGTSVEVSQLRKDIQAIDEKNTSLKSDLLSYSSYARVASHAAELGFVETKDSAIMLDAPLQVALSR